MCIPARPTRSFAKRSTSISLSTARPAWDEKDKCVVETFFIAPDDVGSAAHTLSRHTANADKLAAHLIEYAKSGEDPKRVAAALSEESTAPACAWELRTPAKCQCATHEGTSPGKKRFDDPFFFTHVAYSPKGARFRCGECGLRSHVQSPEYNRGPGGAPRQSLRENLFPRCANDDTAIELIAVASAEHVRALRRTVESCTLTA